MAKTILVVGGGFAGLWAAVSAARARALFAVPEEDLEVVLVAADPNHIIRVRCYEANLKPIRVPLDEVLTPINVQRIAGRAIGIDPAAHALTLDEASGVKRSLNYDRLILASGSALVRPPIPIEGETFDVDSYEGAKRLAAHLSAFSDVPRNDAISTVVVIGGGLVGVEIACELPDRLRATLGADAPVRVLLVDRGEIGADMGNGRDVILEALAALNIETRPRTVVAAVTADGVILDGGEHILAGTVIFATGMKASALTLDLGVECDKLGRAPVDRFLEVEGVKDVYAAGDCASAAADDLGHVTVMSCQHARPMGRLAGHNSVCDLTGRQSDRVPFSAPDYVTVLDLGPFGAVYTAGWDRGTVVAKGADAKATKQTINGTRIYPPRDATRDAIFATATPIIQVRPG